MPLQTFPLDQTERAILVDNECDCLCTGDPGDPDGEGELGPCCPDYLIAKRLYLTISGASGDCSDSGCMNDLDPTPMNYTVNEWQTDGFSIIVPEAEGCRGTEDLDIYEIQGSLTCHDTAGSFELRLTGCLFDYVGVTHDSLTCDETTDSFEVVYTGSSGVLLNIGACCKGGNNTDNITVTISE